MTTKTTRRLTLGQLVSWTTGKMFCTWEELTEVASFMLGRRVPTLALNLHADRIREELLRQHPILSTITALDRETARLPLDSDTQSFIDEGVTISWTPENEHQEALDALTDSAIRLRLTACGCSVGTGTHCIHGAMVMHSAN